MGKAIVALVALTILIAGIGCASLSELVTPAVVDSQAVDYAVGAGVAKADDFAGYANLEKALRLEVAVDNAYEVKALAITQMAEKNQLEYSALRDVVAGNMKIARQREDRLFGETGLLSMGLTALGFGGLTGVLGLMRRRPGDVTPQEMEQAVAGIKGEVTQKDRQIFEIVKGVQKFLNVNGDKVTPDNCRIGDALKQCLATEQSADTKQVVAVTKAGLS